jgi:hypothetical protein
MEGAGKAASITKRVDPTCDGRPHLTTHSFRVSSSQQGLPQLFVRLLLRPQLQTYIENNHAYIPNFGERYRSGDTISTAFVESTVNQVISKRFVKKQSMVRHEVARRKERMSTLSVVLSCVPGTG